MNWLAIQKTLTDTVIDRFSQPVIYTPKGGIAVEIETEFRARYVEILSDGYGNDTESVQPRLLINHNLVPDTLSVVPFKGDTFTASGSSYRIVNVKDSGVGYWQCFAVEIS